MSASGGNLIADSRILWSEVPPETDGYSAGGCSEFQDALVSADGETVMCTSSYGPDTDRPAGKIVPWHLAWLATSVAAPKTARPVYAFTIDSPIAVQWLALRAVVQRLRLDDDRVLVLRQQHDAAACTSA